MYSTKSSLLILLLLGLLFGSCQTHKKLVYFQDSISENDSLSVKLSFTPTLKTDDLLSITVSTDDPETAVPFNLNQGLQNPNLNNGYTMGNPERVGYLIDENGKINFPVLGRMEIAGLKRTEAISLLEDSLINYVSNPIVNIQILNYKVTVLGDVGKPGTFKIPNERITVLEAIGLAGDLNITGNRKNVKVLRDENGKKSELILDLTSSCVFSSPAYYLQQNDVVYVEPNSAARNNSTVWKTSGSIFISTVALIITTINVLLIK
jgi:polysaccharide export outer membrane protein